MQPIRIESMTLAMPPATADTPARTITGMIVPFGTTAMRTSAGPVRLLPGSLVTPADLSRVKLFVTHDDNQSVGFATSITPTETEVTATFQVARTPAGDDALLQAAEKSRDGLSVGIDIREGYLSADGSEYLVASAVLHHVALCSIPAFDDARVTEVNFSTHTPEGTTMPKPDPSVAPIVTETKPPVTIDATSTPTPPAPVAPPFLQSVKVAEPATITAAFERVASMIQTGANAAQITAALADITPDADPGQGLLPPSRIGEVWRTRETPRNWIESAASARPLTSGFKMLGWAWKTLPTVAAYAGKKAEIPSSPAATEMVEAAVTRTAGGWDIDRIYVDLADGAMLEALFRMAMEDYALKTEALFRKALVAAATPVTPNPVTLQDALVTLGLQASKQGSRIDYLAIAPDIWAQLAGLTREQLPWWFGSGDAMQVGTAEGKIGPVRMWVDPALTAGQFVAGDKRAALWWEKTPPVRVSAVDLPRGGVDIAVFGYHANLVNEPKAVFKGKVGA